MSHDEQILTQQRIVSRELGSIAYMRERGPAYDLAFDPNLERAVAAVGQVRAELAAGRGLLGARAAEVDAWLAANERTLAELQQLREAVAFLRAEVEVEGYGAIRITEALGSVERNLERDPERAHQAWSAVCQLIGPLEAPHLATVPEVLALLGTYRELRTRALAELPARLAAHRARADLEATGEALDRLRSAIDLGDEEDALARRAELRAAAAKLSAEAAELPEAAELRERMAAELARSEQEIGPQLVLRELEQVERIVAPLVDHVERGLAARSAPRLVEHAPRLRARLPLLAPYLVHDRAQRLDARARTALAQIERELGPELADEIARAEAVPAFAIEPGTDTRVEAAVRRLNESLAWYRGTYAEAQAAVEAELDLERGTPDAVTRRVLDNVEAAQRELVRAARTAEERAAELAALAPTHPAPATIAETVPVLLQRAKQWRARVAARCQLATVIDEARAGIERAIEARAEGVASTYQALDVWPQVLAWLAASEDQLRGADELLPDEPEHLARWRERLASERAHAVAQLEATCLTEATRLATTNQMDEAQRMVDVLAEAVPTSTEPARIAAMIAGTADARERAALEIEQHGALIRRCAERSARAARHLYDSFVAERPPIVALGGQIVANLDRFRGAWVAGRCSHLGIFLADEADTIHGDVYQIDYAPEVREQLAAGMRKLDEEFASRARQTAAAAGVEGLQTTTQHYPRDARYHAEIVGIASYTPRHEVRNAHGVVIHTIDGTPYPVPRVVIRAVATTYFVVVPGEPFHLDEVEFVDEGY